MNRVPNNLPSTIGVYIFKASSGEILYIGKSVNIKARVKSHFENAKLDAKEGAIIDGSYKIETVATESEFKALILESSLIQKFRPKYNKIWMDDKSYLYVRITTSEEYPKISLIRRSDIKTLKPENPKIKKDLFFGPFSSKRTLEQLLREIRRVIPFCTARRLTKTPCFYSKIGLCDPCPSYINQLYVGAGLRPARAPRFAWSDRSSDLSLRQIKDLRREYKNNIKEIIKIFNGKVEIVLKDLRKELSKLSVEQKYEEALIMRNRIERFEKLISERNFDNDIFSVGVRNCEPHGAHNCVPLQEIVKILKPYFTGIDNLKRIECYDVSNLNFREATAAMTVAVDGQVDKGQYRKFKITPEQKNTRTKEQSDRNFLLRSKFYVLRSGPVDWDFMKSIFLRRFKHQEWQFPNLLVVDGGKPQVRMAVECMGELNLKIPVIGIAKNPDRLVIGMDNLPTIRPELNNSGFNLIRLLRDEAHRFGRKYHLFLREKKYN